MRSTRSHASGLAISLLCPTPPPVYMHGVRCTRPYCCWQDPWGYFDDEGEWQCQGNSEPPCWVSKAGSDFGENADGDDVRDWEVYDAIVTVRPRSDQSEEQNWTRVDWAVPTLFRKGYRYWMQCSSMEECVAARTVDVSVDGGGLQRGARP